MLIPEYYVGHLAFMLNKALLFAQIPTSLAIIAFVPTNIGKLAALVAVWVFTFRTLSRAEGIFFLAICVFFTAMNAMSLKQGIFWFTSPDILGMPIYELFMWGFYLLHLKRVVGGPAPTSKPAVIWTLALLYSAAFGTIQDSNTLLLVTGVLLVVALALYHERQDLMYVGYLVLMGAAFEYTGVHSGEWSYPGTPLGGVPLWFITLWGGVGLFMRRLALPLILRHEQD